jgi:hypothetical protein
MKPGRSTPTLAILAVSAGALALVGGCANPRGTASALSPIQHVSSAAVSSPAVVSSPAASSVSAATSSPPATTRIEDSTQINGAYTTDNERQLVINYVAGDCTVSARGVATETSTSITVHVKETTRNAVCEAIGYIRNAVAPLSAPWGHRVVLDSSGAVVPVVDGALLLSPSWLPAGYQGGQIVVGGADGKVGEAQEWGPPAPASNSSGPTTCQPTPAAVSLAQGDSELPPYPTMPGNQTLANGALAIVEHDDHGDLTLDWTPPGYPGSWMISLQSEQGCPGYQPLSLDTLLKIANSLH